MARILFFLSLQTATRRCYQKKSFGRQKVKQTTFGIHSRITVTFTHMHMITFAQCTNPNGLRFWIPRLRFLISDTGFWILCQWNLDSGFQSLVGFRIPPAKFPDFGFHMQKLPRLRSPNSLTCGEDKGAQEHE